VPVVYTIAGTPFFSRNQQIEHRIWYGVIEDTIVLLLDQLLEVCVSKQITALIFALLVLVPAAAPSAYAGPQGLEGSVVRIVNFSQRGNWYSPWDVTDVAQGTGTGFVIDGGLIMTNAHVISDSRLLVLFIHNDPEPYVAELVHVAHDCDLALVRPVDPGVLSDVLPLKIGDLPTLGSVVDTLGYPAGGTQISSTRGVVSRIDETLYIHSGVDLHVSVQTDAAINPGNSGGPVVQGGEVVGVAFQADLRQENVGFFIPSSVINRFLRDVEDGRYDGYPELGAETSGMENPAIRAWADMADGETGVRVTHVHTDSSADGLVRKGDVILAVDGRTVANDGSVADGDSRISFGMMADRKQIGETLRLRILRDGSRFDVDVRLLAFPAGDTRGNLYDQFPRYYVYAGLVFVPLDREMLKTYGAEWFARADKNLMQEFYLQPLYEPESMLQERVVLLRRLDHPVNADMAWFRNLVVKRINGREITGMDDLVESLENYQGDYHLIEFAHRGRFGVLDRRKAEETHQEILERYGIAEDRNL
jgi:S1-C subfamily serine protease